MGRLIAWDSKGPTSKGIHINMIDDFDAGGLHRLYERTDVFPKIHSFNMTIWKDREDRLLARFWSRGIYSERESYEIIGIKAELISRCQEKDRYSDKWVPECLRDAYDEWVTYDD